MKAKTSKQEEIGQNSIIQNILFPTDFSDEAMQAFEFAVEMADQLGANIILYHAYHYAVTGEFFVVPELIERIHAEMKDQALTEFQKYETQARARVGSKMKLAYKVDQDFAVEGILRVIQEAKADMVIMGTKGGENVWQRWMGSLTSLVIERAEIPVLAIPAEMLQLPIRHILYATNFEEQDQRIPALVPALAQQLNADLTCLHIRTLSEVEQPQTYQEAFEKMKESVGDQVTSECVVLHAREPWQGIEEYMQHHRVDLVVTLTRHHTLLERLFQRSVTREAALKSEWPILALKS
ncbi:MAG: universal stress protein [Bacteroidota bacterium]